MITTQNLTKQFKTTVAVDSLSLNVAQGEVFGFLGPNGAGKTTTVRMLSALIAPTKGTARVAGFDIQQQPMDVRRSVGILTETPGMYESLSAYRNLEIYASLYEVRDIPGQIEKYLRILGLWDRRNDPVGTFSKGMCQKLAIARALLHEPKVVFLDEPTSGLDPEAARLVRDFIAELRHQGRTIFLCTHNLDEADRLCDRVGVFRSRLLVVDTPQNLRTSIFGRRVVFHLVQADEALRAQIAALPFVTEAQRIDNKLVLTLNNPETHNPEIVRILVGAGAQIQFVGELRRSLEDVYLQLMHQTPSPGGTQ